jgi:hypothetical protein
MRRGRQEQSEQSEASLGGVAHLDAAAKWPCATWVAGRIKGLPRPPGMASAANSSANIEKVSDNSAPVKGELDRLPPHP